MLRISYNQSTLDSALLSRATQLCSSLLLSTYWRSAMLFVVASTGEDVGYKAIVYLYLAGGMDSYNLFVPVSDCLDGEDVYGHYAEGEYPPILSHFFLLFVLFMFFRVSHISN